MSRSRWPVVALGEVLRLAVTPEAIHPDRTYPALGVYGFGRGVITDKPAVLGSHIAASVLFKVKAGQFIYSKLKAFEGAFALVPNDADGRFVSNEFPTFDCDAQRLYAPYLAWLFRQPATWMKLSAESTGIGARRERVHPEQLLRFQCSLPPLSVQKSCTKRLDGAADRIAQRAKAVKAIEAELDAMLQAAFHRITAGAPMARLGDVAPLVRRPIVIEPDVVYREIGARSFGRGLFRKPDLRAEDLTWQQLFGIEEGDLVFSNIKAWEGAFAVANATHNGCVGSHRYLTCLPDTTRTTPGFLWFYLQSPNGLSQVQAASPGSADRNRTLSTRALADLRIPLPSLDAQRTFDRLHAKAEAALATQRAATAELDKLIPALLHEAFGAGAAVAMPAAAA